MMRERVFCKFTEGFASFRIKYIRRRKPGALFYLYPTFTTRIRFVSVEGSFLSA